MTASLSQPPLGDCGNPAGWGAKAAVADPRLPHQIAIRMGGQVKHRLYVTCNCLLNTRQHGPYAVGSVPTLGYFQTLGEAWGLYNAHLTSAAGVA